MSNKGIFWSFLIDNQRRFKTEESKKDFLRNLNFLEFKI
jgi:hypothetical protein